MASTGKIVVSADMGCSTSSLIVKPFYQGLQSVFRTNLSRRYFHQIEYLSIVFRVSGAIADFGGEGPERLAYRKKHGHITIDLVIPESRWRDIPEETIREYIANGVEQCFELLVRRALDLGEICDETALRQDFVAAMKAFRAG